MLAGPEARGKEATRDAPRAFRGLVPAQGVPGAVTEVTQVLALAILRGLLEEDARNRLGALSNRRRCGFDGKGGR